jgi:asparagine synthase (glutamine-hydrolysing)
MGLPRDMKVRGRTGKYILKKALEPILPHDLLYSNKRGFGAPIREWFRTSLGNTYSERLLNSSIHRRDYFNKEFVVRMLSEHRSGRADWSFHLWALLNLSLWYEHWIDNG